MKRSKIFLGLTTAVLAVAGVAAAEHYQPTATKFYITNANAPVKYCKAVSLPCTGGIFDCIYIAGGLFLQAYTRGPEGTIPLGSNKCKFAARYLPE
jgi:hypothetical protein